jgi:hypothetical protein
LTVTLLSTSKGINIFDSLKPLSVRVVLLMAKNTSHAQI